MLKNPKKILVQKRYYLFLKLIAKQWRSEPGLKVGLETRNETEAWLARKFVHVLVLYLIMFVNWIFIWCKLLADRRQWQIWMSWGMSITPYHILISRVFYLKEGDSFHSPRMKVDIVLIIFKLKIEIELIVTNGVAL